MDEIKGENNKVADSKAKDKKDYKEWIKFGIIVLVVLAVVLFAINKFTDKKQQSTTSGQNQSILQGLGGGQGQGMPPADGGGMTPPDGGAGSPPSGGSAGGSAGGASGK